MMRHVAVGALLACLGLCVALWWQSSTVSDLEAENALLERNARALGLARDQARLAADVAAARARGAMEMRAQAAARIEDFRNLNLEGCADAPFDPDFSRALDGLLWEN